MPERFVLPHLSRPVPDQMGLDEAYWKGLHDERLLVQYCETCQRWLWGPEWICPTCHGLDVGWKEVPTRDGRYVGTIYSYERTWHPPSPALSAVVPYVTVLVELPAAGSIRMIGNWLAPSDTEPVIGTEVAANFEHREDYSLVHWMQHL